MAEVASPAHLAFERCCGQDFDPAAYKGLVKPDPKGFYMPLSSEDDGK